MWIVFKYKRKEFGLLRQDFRKILGDMPLFFRPRYKYQKLVKNKVQFLEKDILDDYLICYHEKFKNTKLLSFLRNLRGLKYFLTNSSTNQREIESFIDHCKKKQIEDSQEITNNAKIIMPTVIFRNFIIFQLRFLRDETVILRDVSKTFIFLVCKTVLSIQVQFARR